MGDHYVPQFYLKGFAESDNSRKIWVFEKGNEKSVNTAIHNIAQENQFYSREVEKYLANEIENPANKVLDKIKKFEKLTNKDKFIFARYMLVLWKRVPKQKEWMKAIAPEMLDKIIDQKEKELIEIGNRDPSKIRNINILRNRLHMFREEDQGELFIETWLENIPANKTPKSINVLCLMTWRFFVLKRSQYYITCDNPFFFFRNIGIGNEKAEVTFPVTKYIALQAVWCSGELDGYYDTKKPLVMEINRRSVSNSLKYIYSPKNEDWIGKLANKQNVRLKRYNPYSSTTILKYPQNQKKS